MDLVLVAALHNHWIREQSLSSVTWTALEYLGMVLYTADTWKQLVCSAARPIVVLLGQLQNKVMVQIGGLLPAATVKLGWLPRIVSDESAAAKSLLPKHSPDSGRPYNKVGA